MSAWETRHVDRWNVGTQYSHRTTQWHPTFQPAASVQRIATVLSAGQDFDLQGAHQAEQIRLPPETAYREP